MEERTRPAAAQLAGLGEGRRVMGGGDPFGLVNASRKPVRP
jgi:hypothetical protein